MDGTYPGTEIRNRVPISINKTIQLSLDCNKSSIPLVRYLIRDTNFNVFRQHPSLIFIPTHLAEYKQELDISKNDSHICPYQKDSFYQPESLADCSFPFNFMAVSHKFKDNPNYVIGEESLKLFETQLDSAVFRLSYRDDVFQHYCE